jgi:polyisoprenoid-binding protein YceI
MNIKAGILLLAFAMIGSASFLKAQKVQKPGTGNRVSADVAETRIHWTGKKPTAEHNGYIKLLKGELILDNNKVTGGTFVIDMQSIVNVDIKDKNTNDRLIKHLKSSDFFDIGKYPEATYVITNITVLPAATAKSLKATHEIKGNLTMKNITREVSFKASLNIFNGKVIASSLPFTIDRTQWGVNYQSKSIFAGIKDQFIYDEISLAIDLYSK